MRDEAIQVLRQAINHVRVALGDEKADRAAEALDELVADLKDADHEILTRAGS